MRCIFMTLNGPSLRGHKWCGVLHSGMSLFEVAGKRSSAPTSFPTRLLCPPQSIVSVVLLCWGCRTHTDTYGNTVQDDHMSHVEPRSCSGADEINVFLWQLVAHSPPRSWQLWAWVDVMPRLHSLSGSFGPPPQPPARVTEILESPVTDDPINVFPDLTWRSKVTTL